MTAPNRPHHLTEGIDARREPFRKLDIDDPRRPIKVLGTVEAEVPAASRRFLGHQIDRVRFPNGNKGWHHRLSLPEGVMLAHIDEKERVTLVQNYRHAIGRDSVELPSGGAEPEEIANLLQAAPLEKEVLLVKIALREFREEVGWEVEPEKINRLLPGPLQGSVGFADQTYHTYWGEGGYPARQDLDNGEAKMLTHKKYSIEEAGEMIGGQIVDPASAVAIMALANLYGKRLPFLPHSPIMR